MTTVALICFLLGLLLAGLTYWIDYCGDTKVYGGVVISLWLAVALCLFLTVALVLITAARFFVSMPA
jgi:hypothetical protein